MRTISVLLCSLLLASVVLNLMLARKVKSLNETIEVVKNEQLLKEGAAVPAIAASAVDGSAAIIRFDSVSVPTILYVFTPACGWCTRNLPAAKALAENVKGQYRVVGLSLSSDGLQMYVGDSGLSFPVYTEISGNTRSAFHLGGTPDTIVVSSDGKVIKHWQGAYVGLTKKEVESYFNVTLPAVSDQ
jgi:hypothetical protein